MIELGIKNGPNRIGKCQKRGQSQERFLPLSNMGVVPSTYPTQYDIISFVGLNVYSLYKK